jgi:hypothetical protein
MELLTTSPILFHIFYSRSVSRTIFNFQSNRGGRAVTSVVICESRCYEKNLIFILICFCTTLSCLCVESSALVCQVLIGFNLRFFVSQVINLLIAAVTLIFVRCSAKCWI